MHRVTALGAMLLASLASSSPACRRTEAPPSERSSGIATEPPPATAASSVTSSASTTASLADARDFISTLVKAGYEPREAIIQATVDVYSEDLRGVDLARDAARMADEELAAHKQREATWKSATDCDRLDHALAELEKNGIIARQNFSDCGTCGAAEIVDEMKRARTAGKRLRGYVFFHQQDAEGAVEGSLHMSYGTDTPSEAAHLAIARELVAALKNVGFTPQWNGRLDTRVGLSHLAWKKRRFTSAPALD